MGCLIRAYSPHLEMNILGVDVVTAECGRTHLLVNGNENLMDGEPYISDSGQFVMEVSAIASYIDGVSAWYDDKVEVFRIETK